MRFYVFEIDRCGKFVLLDLFAVDYLMIHAKGKKFDDNAAELFVVARHAICEIEYMFFGLRKIMQTERYVADFHIIGESRFQIAHGILVAFEYAAERHCITFVREYFAEEIIIADEIGYGFLCLLIQLSDRLLLSVHVIFGKRIKREQHLAYLKEGISRRILEACEHTYEHFLVARIGKLIVLRYYLTGKRIIRFVEYGGTRPRQFRKLAARPR